MKSTENNTEDNKRKADAYRVILHNRGFCKTITEMILQIKLE